MMKKFRLLLIMVMLLAITMTLTSCVPGDGVNTASRPAGFFWGIWHGWVAPISLIIGIFKHHIRVYEIHNIGWWYDAGFYIAVISGFGGISLSRRKKYVSKHSKNCD
ncbi:hypothetical protein A8990_115106 [Paenibacillus taihuensis]|uniref:Lipoprotein n=1 Tax=Paenibacillus taihuensis TaxID=1156355 RepID=A0A3D9RYB7_9BACL|nr:hypothetical protein [Paenibacillus taihuensis]REE84428.1 hypothetical protein A8990_115106 [Paenibacillus taihuensis]